jgi:hypothetical protein
MTITHFVTDNAHNVTVYLEEMPKIGARVANTTVYIAGEPQGSPDEVSGTNGTVTFFAGSARTSGPISVMIDMQDGQLTATSAERYEVEQPGQTHKPVVTVCPTTAAVGETVTLRGRRLGRPDVEQMMLGIKQILNPTLTDTSIRFTIPDNMQLGRQVVKLKGNNTGGFESMNKYIDVTARQNG